MLVKRKIIKIDEDLCNGCGQCILDCAEGAIQIVNGKAKLISDNLCDGLGECMNGCPQDALEIIERNADEFDEKAVENHLQENKKCGSLKMSPFDQSDSTVSNWPIQISLISPDSDIFENSDLLIAADCVSGVCRTFHDDIAGNKKLMIGCPKLDSQDEYKKKFEYIFKTHNLKSLTLAKMEVPCCSGMENIIKDALKSSGSSLKANIITVSRSGKIL